MSAPPSDARTTADPGWDLVRLAEVSPDRLKARVREEIARGESDYEPPKLGGLVSSKLRKVIESPTNRARLERFSDYIVPGDSILEIGPGAGFLATRVLRAGAAAYRAVDISSASISLATKVLHKVGLQDRVESITQQDVYTLQPGDLSGVSLVVCSEVIEHVPDPERALRVLGAALPKDAELLFSVPLLGQLELVWGHLSIFTVDRIQHMLREAGLEARHVEPLCNRWVAVLAAPRDGTTANTRRGIERLTQVEAGAARYGPRPTGSVPALPPQPTRFDWVPLDKVTIAPAQRSRGAKVAVAAATSVEGAITATIRASRWLPRPAVGGVGLSLTGLDPVQGVRLELDIDPWDAVSEVTVTFHGAGRGTAPLGTWTWQPSDRQRQRGGARSFCLRPGAGQGGFRGPSSADLTAADRVEVRASVTARRTTRLSILRLAWIR